MKSASETVEGESDGGDGGGGGDIIDLRPDIGPGSAPDLTDTDTDTDDELFSDAQEETNSSVIFKRRKLSNSRVYRRERASTNNNDEEEEAEAGHSGAGSGQMEAQSPDEDEDIPELENTVELDETSSHSGGLSSPDTEEGETTDVDVATLARDICSKTPRPPR